MDGDYLFKEDLPKGKAPSSSIGYEIKITNQVIRRKMMAMANREGIDNITLMHGWIIDFLYRHRQRDIFQRDIERFFLIGRSSVTNILKLMEKKGYIVRSSIESDARLKKIILTDEGERVQNIINRSIIENETKMKNIFTEEELETFLRLIQKLRLGVENL